MLPKKQWPRRPTSLPPTIINLTPRIWRLRRLRSHPFKAITIPKLELQAATIAVEMSDQIKEAFEVEDQKIYFYTDSKNVLNWILTTSKKLKPFFANRIGQIQMKSNLNNWRYVPSNENPADIASRSSTVEQLRDATQWWHGPTFLITQEYPTLQLSQNSPGRPKTTLRRCLRFNK